MVRDWRQPLVLAALLVGLFAWLRADIERLDARLGARLTRIEERLADLTERVARIAGRLSIGTAPLATADRD